MDKEVCEINMKRVEEKIAENKKEIAGLKKIYKSINELTRAIDKLANETLHLRTEQTELKDTVKALDHRIKSIEMAPATKWEKFVWYVFTFILGAILSVILVKIGLG